jgi:Plasmid encoded RepA protein
MRDRELAMPEYDDAMTGELFPSSLQDVPQKRSAVAERTLKAALKIVESEPDGIDFHHAVLCQVGIPRKKTTERVFERRSGHVSVKLEAGELFNGRDWVPYPLPYGTRPRLALVYASGYALRHRTRDIEIGGSLREFMGRLGIDDQGGKRGNYQMMRNQTMALAAAKMTIGVQKSWRALTIKTDGPVEQFEAFMNISGTQEPLWPGRLRLSEKFYSSLEEFAVPLDPRALGALSDTALGMDIYTWLAHRLCRINDPKGVYVPWAQLRGQFGQEYRLLADFKKAFKLGLQRVLRIYPDARLESVYGGLQLRESRPPIERVLSAARLSAESPPGQLAKAAVGALKQIR